MHVAHLLDALEMGGAQKLLVLFAEEARARDIKVTIISLSTKGTSEAIVSDLRALGVRVEFLTVYKLYDPTALPRLLSVLKKEKIDILQTHLGHSNVLGVMAGALIDIPVIATLHSTHVRKTGRLFYLRFMLEIYCLRYSASRVIAVGKKIEEVYRDKLTQKTVIDIVPNPVKPNPRVSDQVRKQVREEFVDGEDAFVILSVGRLTVEKGINDLLLAFSQVHEKYSFSKLVIVGDGEIINDLKSYSSSLGLLDSVHFTGARNDVPRLMAASDMYVSSSYREGLSLAMLEAMAAGLPVLATNVGDTELLLTEDRGLMVLPHDVDALRDGMMQLIEKPQQAKEMGMVSRDFVEKNYSPNIWMEKMLDIYLQVINGKG